MQGVGVDHDLVGEALVAALVQLLLAHEALAERPVLVHQRHADRAVGIQHLFGRDDLDLVRIEIEPEV
jgi:hypothetical protein